MTKFLSEIFTEVKNAPSTEQKIALLRKHEKTDIGKLLLMALSMTYNSRYQFYTNVIPPYTPDEAPLGLNPSTLYHVLSDLKHIFKGSKRDNGGKEGLLISFYCSMHRNECEVLSGIITKDLTHLGISEELVKQAFPGLLHENENFIQKAVQSVKPMPVSCVPPVGTVMTMTPVVESAVDSVETTVDKPKRKYVKKVKKAKRVISPEFKAKLQANIAKARAKRMAKKELLETTFTPCEIPLSPDAVPIHYDMYGNVLLNDIGDNIVLDGISISAGAENIKIGAINPETGKEVGVSI